MPLPPLGGANPKNAEAMAEAGVAPPQPVPTLMPQRGSMGAMPMAQPTAAQPTSMTQQQFANPQSRIKPEHQEGAAELLEQKLRARGMSPEQAKAGAADFLRSHGYTS